MCRQAYVFALEILLVKVLDCMAVIKHPYILATLDTRSLEVVILWNTEKYVGIITDDNFPNILFFICILNNHGTLSLFKNFPRHIGTIFIYHWIGTVLEHIVLNLRPK